MAERSTVTCLRRSGWLCLRSCSSITSSTLCAILGVSLDSLTEDVLRRSAVFAGEAFQGRLGVERLTIVCPNVANVPASAADDWYVIGGYSEALVGGIGPVITQVINPEDNQVGDGAVVRQGTNPYFNLLNGDGIYRYTIDAI